MGCPTTNNPNGVWCPTPNRRFAEIGKEISGFVKHNSGATTTLSAPGINVTLFSRNRLAEIVWEESYVADTISCQAGPNSPDQYQHTDGYVEAPEYTCTLREKQTIINNDILYLDMRYGITVRKETIYTFDKIKVSNDFVVWNQFGVTINLHKIVPGDIDISVTETIYVNLDVVSTRTFPMKAEIDFAFAFPVFSGTPQGNPTEDFYIWSEHYQDDGGYDLYYPQWLRGISTVSADLDLVAKGLHFTLAVDNLPVSGAVGPVNLVSSPAGVFGGWAVDRSDNRLYSMAGYSRLIIDGETVEIPKESVCDTWYPVSPL